MKTIEIHLGNSNSILLNLEESDAKSFLSNPEERKEIISLLIRQAEISLLDLKEIQSNEVISANPA